ncbi:MAG TPA: UDP-3-O-acyl-N-acetylglucosamine deacetylase [Candidatus Binatia bacterium]|nr:UDP-3-O-acyl-N-acetylglucosamine deacetylase [Candidatus Binatia bacterium]
MAETVLIVDDEEQIRSSVRGVLADEGFRVLEADNGWTALAVIAAERPRLVLLDIWMPQADGIEILREIQKRHPATRVIVISGHGNIETAVRATQLGAVDFIEKPFSIDRLLQRIERALGAPASRRLEDGGVAAVIPLPAPAAGSRASRARTLARSVVINGHGLHSGVRTGLILHPAPPGTGVVFETISSDVEIPALVSYVRSTGYATTLFRGGAAVQTVEHLLATLHAFGITNLRIKMQGEIPILDGSALEFCDLIDAGGLELQEEEMAEFVVDRRIAIGDPGSRKYIALEPCDGFEVDYTLEYPRPVGREHVVYKHGGADTFRTEIAPARTFGFLKDIAALEQMGLAGGGRLHNCILIGDDGVINTELRLDCEFARHKILDIMGDLFLLGRPIRGRVVARMTGHSDNIALLRQVHQQLAS